MWICSNQKNVKSTLKHSKSSKKLVSDVFPKSPSKNIENSKSLERFCVLLTVFWLPNPHFTSFNLLLWILDVTYPYLTNKTSFIEKYSDFPKLWANWGHFYARLFAPRLSNSNSVIFIRFLKKVSSCSGDPYETIEPPQLWF